MKGRESAREESFKKVKLKEDMPTRAAHLLRLLLLLGQHLGAGDERNERDEKEGEAAHGFFVS